MRRRRQRWSINVQVIERERVLRGWTQRQLARSAGVDEGTVTDLLAGRRRPTFVTMQAVRAALGLTLAHVIVLEGESRNPVAVETSSA